MWQRLAYWDFRRSFSPLVPWGLAVWGALHMAGGMIDGLSHQPSAATGTVMRPLMLEKYAQEAGFSGVAILPIENDLWRFYQLTSNA